MGSYLSTTKSAAAEAEAPTKCDSPVYATAEVQKVTFADPPASEAKAPKSSTPAAGQPEPVLKRAGASRRGRPARAATATPVSDRPKRSAARTPRAAAAAAAAAPSPAAAAAPAPASPVPAAATPRAVRRAAAGKKKAGGKAAAAVAAPVPELVVVGRAMRQKGAVPARKVGMKRMAKRALHPVGASGSRAARSKK